jgi:hypothetical protein
MSGSSSMTVCTNDVALCNLIDDALPVSVPETASDVESFVATVVEFQHDGVRLAAVDARMLCEEIDEVANPFNCQPSLSLQRIRYITLAIGDIVLVVVVRTARSAVVIPLTACFSPPGKGF